MFLVLCVLASLASFSGVAGHGRMISPASRTSAWRYGFTGAGVDYNDNELFCGGLPTQHNRNGGRCGVCGNSFSGSRTAEPGPANKFARGIIVATYQSGEQVPLTSQVTAAHQGYFEYKLCVNDVAQIGSNPNVRVTQDCFEKHVLREVGTGKTRMEGGGSVGIVTHTVQLPKGVSCSNCVLQWRWRVGNSWGCDAEGCGMGHGNQEEFWNCADVRIVAAPGQGNSMGICGPKYNNKSYRTYCRRCQTKATFDKSPVCGMLCDCSF